MSKSVWICMCAWGDKAKLKSHSDLGMLELSLLLRNEVGNISSITSINISALWCCHPRWPCASPDILPKGKLINESGVELWPYAAGAGWVAWTQGNGTTQNQEQEPLMQVCERRQAEHPAPHTGQVIGACLCQDLLVGGFYSIVQKCPRDESPAHEPWQQQDARGRLTAPRWESWALQSLCISVPDWSFLEVSHFSSSSNKACFFWAFESLFKAWVMLPQKANEAESRFERSPAPSHEVPTLSALSVWCHLQLGCWALRGVLETPPHTHILHSSLLYSSFFLCYFSCLPQAPFL